MSDKKKDSNIFFFFFSSFFFEHAYYLFFFCCVTCEAARALTKSLELPPVGGVEAWPPSMLGPDRLNKARLGLTASDQQTA